VFAVTQLSHYLLRHPTVPGVLQAGLLLMMVWLVWAYTTWVTNWLDPEQIAVRLAAEPAASHAAACGCSVGGLPVGLPGGVVMVVARGAGWPVRSRRVRCSAATK